MSIPAAEYLVGAVAIYAGCGTAFALPFLWRWIGSLDPAAEHGTVGFKLLVLPGVTVFWPLLAARVIRGRAR